MFACATSVFKNRAPVVPSADLRLLTYFDGNSSADVSQYLRGPGTLVGAGASVTGGAFTVNSGTNTENDTLTWNSTFGFNQYDNYTLEFFMTLTTNPNVSYSQIMEFNMGGGNNYYRLGSYGGSSEYLFHAVGDTSNQLGVFGGGVRKHVALVFSTAGVRIYIAGSLIFTYGGGNYRLSQVPSGGYFRIGNPSIYGSATPNNFSYDEVAIWRGERYSGSSIVVPAHIPIV